MTMIGATVAAWNQSYDKEYLTPISVGNPPQAVDVDMDTGSSDWYVCCGRQICIPKADLSIAGSSLTRP